MREPLSVLVTTRNEEHGIRACLESARWAEEIVVVDSGSTDRTISIARSIADRVLEHEYESPAAQKNWALPQLEHRWVLILDADEAVSPELRREIEATLADPLRRDGYWIYRDNHFFGKRVRSAGWQRDKVLRLFDRTKGAYPPVLVHEEIALRGAAGVLRARLRHEPYRDLDRYFQKWDRYTRWSAAELERRGIRATAPRLLFRPWLRFLRMYVLEGGFREGRRGLVLCWLAAFSVFTKYARRWESESGAKRRSPEGGISERGAPERDSLDRGSSEGAS
ncbi:MAG: glycosyltransferase family 2 protein [Candidatus Latescibacteria bacterium]|nr:glycosyltransferase family 2 protein [Candidatus Latescibacterota bacterium]